MGNISQRKVVFFTVNIFAVWLVWAGFACTVPLALLKQLINLFKPVLQKQQQKLRAYCPNIYTVFVGFDEYYRSFSTLRFERAKSSANL